MKVRISLTVEVDPDAWRMNYGDMSAAEIRRDVQSDVQNYLYTHPSEAITPTDD
ncbi:MAG: hypothetical protein QJR09_05140 [Micrococcus sp.]|nr:hypothetical protein [Micrococcus sp.]